MNLKKTTGLFTTVVLLLAVMAAAVSAQPGRGTDRHPADGDVLREIIAVLIKETGLTPREFIEAVRADDTTPADVIEANGGDIEVVVTETVAIITERVMMAAEEGKITEERADAILANLESDVRAVLNGEGNVLERLREWRKNTGDRRAVLRELAAVITEETGLTLREIRQQVSDGATLAEVIEANEGSVDAVVDAAESAITERVTEALENERITQERADQILDGLDETIREFLNSDFSDRPRRGR